MKMFIILLAMKSETFKPLMSFFVQSGSDERCGRIEGFEPEAPD